VAPLQRVADCAAIVTISQLADDLGSQKLLQTRNWQRSSVRMILLSYTELVEYSLWRIGVLKNLLSTSEQPYVDP
jgi:hypothetical protein